MSMVERRQIVEQWRRGGAKVLVTLVRAEGSSYRRPGARMLIGAGGSYTGSISGGCLEAEVVRKAEWMVRAGATVERYSTMFDDTAEMPYGLGCGGVVDLLLEPVDTPEGTALLEAMEASLAGRQSRVMTRLPGAGGPLARVVYAADGAAVFATKGEAGKDFVQNEDTFAERLARPQRLFLLGAGDDARPVAKLAALLGWSVTVADGRPQMARAERFPRAEHVLGGTSLKEFRIDATDAVVVMTHSYEQDRAFLTELFARGTAGPGYIGLLGAWHRSGLLVAEAAAAAGLPTVECCERVYAPVGLDLGGDGAEAIALAIVAQVQAWAQGKPGTARRLRAEDVAEQAARGGSARYVRTQCAVSAGE